MTGGETKAQRCEPEATKPSWACKTTLSISMVLYFRETVYSCKRSPIEGEEGKGWKTHRDDKEEQEEGREMLVEITASWLHS